MLNKRKIGVLLFILAIITFIIFYTSPLIFAKHKLVTWALVVYIVNKVFLYSSVFLLGREYYFKIANLFPRVIEKILIRFYIRLNKLLIKSSNFIRKK